MCIKGFSRPGQTNICLFESLTKETKNVKQKLGLFSKAVDAGRKKIYADVKFMSEGTFYDVWQQIYKFGK